MGYCSLTDVQALFPQVQFSSTTPVSQTDVTNLVDAEIPNYIDRRLSKFYQVPITGPNSLALLNAVAKKLVAAEVAARLMMAGGAQESTIGQGWRAEAEAVLKDISNSRIVLDDAVPIADAPVAWSHMFSNGTAPTATDANGNAKVPFFARSDVW